MRIGVVVWPGSNCDQDALQAAATAGFATVPLWHEEADIAGVDAVILPGGFSYGDYLRPGALAATAPVMRGVRTFAARGGPVLGICNGFQILCEAGLLPGALQTNRDLAFHCHEVTLRVEAHDTPWTCAFAASLDDPARDGTDGVGELTLPIAHGGGCYTAPPAVLAELARERRIVFRYRRNPNGSAGDIAGICNAGRNVVGLMPHPERRVEGRLGGDQGLALFRSLTRWAVPA